MISTVLVLAGLTGVAAFVVESRRRRRHPVDPGLCLERTIPHDEPFELYHNALSLCSMKTRVCLAELRIPYKSHHVHLVETGGYENIRADFLRVNPAGTVPVLVHDGHPVYESHEQIRYAARFAPDDAPSLVPDDPALKEEMDRWIDRSSITHDPIREGHLSIGNTVPGQTMPLFATMVERISVLNILEGSLFHFDKIRPTLFLLLKAVGISGIRRIPPIRDVVVKSREQMAGHLDALEKQLEDRGGPFILGEQFTLADVGWMVVFERLRQANAEDAFLGGDGRDRVRAYWSALESRDSYREAIVECSHPTIEYGTRRIVEAKAADPELARFLGDAAA